MTTVGFAPASAESRYRDLQGSLYVLLWRTGAARELLLLC